jgi:phi13 family phage major tail protein
MAAIGLRNVKYGKYAVTDGVIGYTGGRLMGAAINADLNIEVTEAILYTEDSEDEVVKEFAGGTLSIGVKELDYTTQADLLGHTKTDAGSGTPESLLANADDSAVPVGVGFMVPVKRNGVTMYRSIFLTKVTFGEPAMSFKTKQKTIEFATPTIVGTVQRDVNGDWKYEAIHDTATAAAEWIDDKLGIAAA